jgi:hypothetical protein
MIGGKMDNMEDFLKIIASFNSDPNVKIMFPQGEKMGLDALFDEMMEKKEKEKEVILQENELFDEDWRG